MVTDELKKQEEGKETVMCKYIDMLGARGEAWGEARGEKRGETIGDDRMAKLIQILLKEKKISEVEAVSGNREKRHELYKHYGI